MKIPALFLSKPHLARNFNSCLMMQMQRPFCRKEFAHTFRSEADNTKRGGNRRSRRYGELYYFRVSRRDRCSILFCFGLWLGPLRIHSFLASSAIES